MGLLQIDLYFFTLINGTLRLDVLDPVMVFATRNPPLIALALVLGMSVRDKKMVLVYAVVAVIALGLADLFAGELKMLVARLRPFGVLEDYNLLVGRGPSFSMPSAHAANSFAVAVTFVLLSRSRLRFVMLGAAFVIAYSRVYVGVHYPSDSLLGAVLGTGVALALVWAYKKLSQKYFPDFLRLG